MKLIFNSSMPRSGSELLQVILHQNPKIYASTTSPLLEYQFAARNNLQLPEVQSQNHKLMEKAFISMCRGMAESYYSEITDRPIVCDKNRGWQHYYEWVEQWNPNPKLLCMVRDLRSIIASMERIFRKTRHLPTQTDNPVNMTNLTLNQRAEHWLTTQPVGIALQRTFDSFQRNIGNNILFVRYEDLCRFPEQVMTRVYEHIEEPYFQHDFNNIVKVVEEDDAVFGVYGNHNVRPKLSPVQENDWANVLPDDVSAAIKENYKWYFSVFNY